MWLQCTSTSRYMYGWLWRLHRVRCSSSNRACHVCMYRIGRSTSSRVHTEISSCLIVQWPFIQQEVYSHLATTIFSLTGRPRDLQYADAAGQCHEIKGTVLEAILHDPASPLIGFCSDMHRRIWCLVRLHDEKECINTHQTS